MSGRLYIVATPIGNLGDITIRAVEMLNSADVIVAENRERALKLLYHLNIRKPIITINSYNEQRKAKEIVQRMHQDADVALLTGAGTPCVSDPGLAVVRLAYEEGIDVSPLPGPSAVTAAVSVSGLHADRFLFFGFLPLKRGKRKKIFREFVEFPYPMIFFESPRRILETLRCVQEELGDRQVVLLKEMTKIYERIFRGTAEELVSLLVAEEPKGEYTFIVEGRAGRE